MLDLRCRGRHEGDSNPILALEMFKEGATEAKDAPSSLLSPVSSLLRVPVGVSGHLPPKPCLLRLGPGCLLHNLNRLSISLQPRPTMVKDHLHLQRLRILQ